MKGVIAFFVGIIVGRYAVPLFIHLFYLTIIAVLVIKLFM